MKRVLMIAVAFALLALVAVMPAASAAPEYEARVEDPTVPLTIVGTSYAVGDRITITVRVTNTGTAVFGSDVCCIVMVVPSPAEPPAEYVYWGWILSGMYPGMTINLTGPEGGLPLNYAGTYEVLVSVMRDFPANGTFDYPDEVISNVAKDSFTVGSAGDYSATVEILSIQAAALGGLAAVGGALAVVRFF